MTTPTIIPGTRPTEVPEVVRGPMFSNFGRFASEFEAGSSSYNHILAMQHLLRSTRCILHPASGLMWLELYEHSVHSRDYDYQVIDMTIYDADVPYHEYVPIAPMILRDVSQEFILEFNSRANILFGADMVYYADVPHAAMHNRMMSWTTVHCTHPYGEGFHAIAMTSAIYNLLEDFITCFFVEWVEFSAASRCMPHFEIRPMTGREKGTLRDKFFEWWRVQSCGRPGMDVPAESSLASVGGCIPDLCR